MSSAQDIPPSPNRLARAVSTSFSISPTATFQSPPSSFGGAQLSRTATKQRELKPFNTEDIKILLLENVNESGKEILSGQGYQVESLKSSLPEDQLIEKIRFVHLWTLPGTYAVLY
jgi:D-3-phosphoglycerate dehydrogenase